MSADLAISVARSAGEIMDRLPSRPEVLDQVIEAVLALGFDTADLCFFSADHTSYDMGPSKGWPEEVDWTDRPSSEGMNSVVLRTGETVTTPNYATYGKGAAYFAELGLGAAMATALRVRGELVGVLSCGRWTVGEHTPAEVEAFELLAEVVGHALEAIERLAGDDHP